MFRLQCLRMIGPKKGKKLQSSDVHKDGIHFLVDESFGCHQGKVVESFIKYLSLIASS